ncbi:hypothetical protein [Streptomyces radiopugnans]|uniref:hypothetical protein n=1 Tax=Streptomyces radiopugnans TaxID=403935 RepID=UPI003F1C6420
MEIVNPLPKFPLLFTNEEGVTDSLPDVEDLGVALEFVDDFDPEYECRDAEGRRVRVIVWDLELLYLQVVPDDFDVSRVEIVEFQRADGVKVFLESFRGRALRSVIMIGERNVVAEPESWRSGVEVPAGAGAPSRMTQEEFNSLWMKARGTKR